MTPDEEIAALLERYPLPSGTELMEPFVDSVDVRGTVIHMVGLAVQYRGECVTGSAGSIALHPTGRAFMELVERLCVVSSVPPRPSEAGQDELRWRPARGNGVAVGDSFADASRRARLELVERDRVLRSWFGESEPVPVSVEPLVPAALLDVYSFEACTFQVTGGLHTAGVFGFPRGDTPLVHGFAARESAGDAIGSAFDECLQRLGFLWGEAVPSSPPEPEPTPAFHQEHYLCPSNHDALRRWLRGEHSRLKGCLRSEPEPGTPAVEAIRPAWLSPALHVARALPERHVPFGFGTEHPLLTKPLPHHLAVHPVA